MTTAADITPLMFMFLPLPILDVLAGVTESFSVAILCGTGRCVPGKGKGVNDELIPVSQNCLRPSHHPLQITPFLSVPLLIHFVGICHTTDLCHIKIPFINAAHILSHEI